MDQQNDNKHDTMNEHESNHLGSENLNSNQIKNIEKDAISPQPSDNKDYKKYFLFVLVGGLVLSCIIAVVAVLVGEFNEVTWRALLTAGSIVFHALIALMFYSMPGGVVQRKINEVYINIILAIVVASFATTVLSLWEILTAGIAGDLYAIYFYTFVFSTLIRMILRATRDSTATRVLADTSTGMSVLLYLMLLPPLFTDYPNTLPEFYYRAMSAVAIILGTTSVLSAVFNRLYISKHPTITVQDSSHSKSHLTLIIVTVLVIGALLIPALLYMTLNFELF